MPTLKKELAQFDSIKPADPPVGESMMDQGREAPPTHILCEGRVGCAAR